MTKNTPVSELRAAIKPILNKASPEECPKMVEVLKEGVQQLAVQANRPDLAKEKRSFAPGIEYSKQQTKYATPAGGSVVFEEDGAVKHHSANGTVTTLVPAPTGGDLTIQPQASPSWLSSAGNLRIVGYNGNYNCPGCGISVSGTHYCLTPYSAEIQIKLDGMTIGTARSIAYGFRSQSTSDCLGYGFPSSLDGELNEVVLDRNLVIGAFGEVSYFGRGAQYKPLTIEMRGSNSLPGRRLVNVWLIDSPYLYQTETQCILNGTTTFRAHRIEMI